MLLMRAPTSRDTRFARVICCEFAVVLQCGMTEP